MEKIKEARIRKRVTQKELADAVGLTNVSICKIEAGLTKPRRSNLEKICKFLELDSKEVEREFLEARINQLR